MASDAVQPTPATWTLRFKHEKTTLLLHVEPLQSLAEVRSQLLRVIRNLGDSFGPVLPSSPNDIVLGILELLLC